MAVATCSIGTELLESLSSLFASLLQAPSPSHHRWGGRRLVCSKTSEDVERGAASSCELGLDTDVTARGNKLRHATQP